MYKKHELKEHPMIFLHHKPYWMEQYVRKLLIPIKVEFGVML